MPTSASSRAPHRSWFARHKILSATLGIFVLGWVLSLLGAGKDSPKSGADVTSTKAVATPVGPRVPNLQGSTYASAITTLGSANLDYTDRDASPRGRAVVDDSNWTVVDTVPKAGAPVKAGQKVTLIVLKNGEYKWFQAHPKMPTITAKTVEQLEAQWAGLDELLEYRYPLGAAPNYASDPLDADSGGTPMLATELAPAKGLKDAVGTSDSLVKGALPTTGQPVRMGRLIYVLVADAPLPGDPGTGSGETYDPNVPNPDLPNHLPNAPSFHHHGGKWWR